MPAHATAPHGANRHALRTQGGAAAAATSTPRPRSRLLRLGLMGVLVLCLQGFSPSVWVAPAVAQVVGGGTLLINETFTGTSVPDPDFTVHGTTCLTGALGAPPAGEAQIPDCMRFNSGRVPPSGVTPGYLQLTDTLLSGVSDILYNRPIPATAGLIATFDQWQYGGSGGDGRAFFLIDGATPLTQIGGRGGSLGYAQLLTMPGILGGVLGLGLDVFGNYYNDDEGRGVGCTPPLTPPFPTALARDVVTLRGPGDREVGYCYLGSTTRTSLGPDPHPESTLPGSLRAETLELAQRRVRITVQPTTGSVAPRIIVEMDFHDGMGLQTVLVVPAPPNLPATYKFGWTGSTGGANDVHLLGNVVVSTVAPLHQLDLVKYLDRTNDLPDPLVAGSVVPYQFLVTNGGLERLTALEVQDATLGPVACPITTLLPAPGLGSSVVCTGAHTLTQAEVDAGVVINTATATALNPENQPVTSNPSIVRLVVGTAPRLALQKFVVEPPPYTLGQPVTFRYNLTNEGNVTLTNPRVTDDKFTDVEAVVCLQSPTLLQSPLRSASAFSAATVCTGTHVLQASDLDASGVFTNTAVGFADAPDGATVASDPATASLPVGTDIAVTKGVEPPAPVLGEVLTYTVTATNQGAVDATGVQVTDVLPAGIPFLAALPPAGTTYEPATGVWTIGALARGVSATLVLQGRVTATGPQTNVARLSALNQVDSNPANDQAEATVEEQTPFADLAVTQTVSNAAPLVGETVTFTVTATNHGPEAASGLTLSDVVRAGLVLVSATPSQGTYTPATGAWALGALPVQAQATLTLVVQVVQAGLILNVATKTAGDQVDPNISNNSSVVALTSEPVADLQVHKTADQRVLPLGSDVTFTVTVTNVGPSAASGVAVTDVLPEGLALVSFTPSQGTYTPATGEWALGALAAGTQTTLTLRATVEAVGPLTNRAAKTAQTELDPNPANDASGVTVNGQAADVQVVTTVDRPTPRLGETVTFTVTVTNNGPNTATGVQVRDVLSERLTFVGATASHGTYTAATGLWEVGTLARAGAAATATLQIRATVTQAGPLTNLAVKIAQDQPDPNPTNDQDRLTLPGQPLADLVVTKSNGVRSVVPGTEVTYTVVVTNRGPSAVTGATVSDPVPLLLVDPSQRLPSFADLTWTCVASAGSLCPVGGTGNVLATVDLLVGGTATFTLRGRVAPAATGTLVNTATVIAPAEVLDPLPGNNSATDTDRLTPPADLRITKTDHVTGTAPGGLLLYTLVVTNTGPSAVTGARVVDPVPTALTGVTWTCTASPGSRCPAAGTGAIDVTVDLLAGGTATFTILATVDPAATGTLVNQATVTGPPGTVDPDGSNNTATEPTEILPIPISTTADLTLVKTNGVSSTVPGATVQYTLVVRNNGPDAVQGATVIDAVPATLTEVIWTCRASPGSRCPAPASGTGPIAVRVDLLSGGAVLFQIRGTVAAAAGDTLRNLAAVLPPPGTRDPTLGNNVAIDTDTVTSPPVGPLPPVGPGPPVGPLPPVGPGPTVFNPPAGRKTVQTSDLPDLAWRVVWRNNANALPLLVRLLEPIPAATTYVDGSVTCVAQGLSIVEFCDFDATTNQVVVDATLGVDPGATTEEQAVNDVVITFQTTVLPGATAVTNQALAHWDATDTDSVDDDISAGQTPVGTGTEFGQNDPTVVTLPGLACLFQQRLLGLTLPLPPTGGPGDSGTGGDGGTGADGAVDEGGARHVPVVPRTVDAEAPTVFTLSTPLEDEGIAGTAVTLAALQLPVAGTTVSQATEVTIANGLAPSALDIVENEQRKTVRLAPQVDQVVITGSGVVVDLPASALTTAESLQLDRVDPAGAPGPLPGAAVSSLVAVTLTSGRTAFSSPVTLRLPYPDAEPDGIVDGTSPALAALALTVWRFDSARGTWERLPEARVFPAFHEVRVATAQTGLYGVFRAADGSTSLAGTTAPASPAPLSAGAQGSGWQDIGVVTTFPFLVPFQTTALPNGTYAVRAICATDPAELRAVVGSAPTTSTVLRTSGDGGGGGCTLHPGGTWSRATALDTVGNLGLPLVVLLVLGLWIWRRPR